MEKCESEKITKIDLWYDEDPDQDVFVMFQGQMRLETKRNVLKLCLERISEKLKVYESEEEVHKKLKSFYALQLEKANILTSLENKNLLKLPGDLVIKNPNVDSEGNYYASDDT